MEYLGRLWLVGRKSKKDRNTSPQKRRCGEESRALKTNLASAVVEPGLTSTTTTANIPRPTAADFPWPTDTVIEIAQFPRPSDRCNPTTTTAASLDIPPRSSSASVAQDAATAAAAALRDDMDYLEYERHVQAQARARSSALFGAPGGRHAWKTLIFWKRRHSSRSSRTSTPARSASLGSVPGVSASSTPLSHYYHAGWSQTPTRKAWVRQQQHPASRWTAALSPLYCADDLGSSPASMRPWYEPMLRRSKLVAVQDEGDVFCNRSPYTNLGARHCSPRLASPGPLYLV